MKSIAAKIWRLVCDNPWVRWPGILVGSAFLFTLYLLISRMVIYNSDNASIVLEGQAMAQGNFLLHGWYMPTDSFLTIEIPLYALGLKLGFAPTALLRLIPALLYTLMVVCGGYLASMLLERKRRVWSLLAFLGIVAFPLTMVQGFLIGPIHIGTVLQIIVGLIAYRFFLLRERGRMLAFAVVMLMVVLTTVGDPFALVLFELPLVLAELVQMLATRKFLFQERVMIAGTLLATGLGFGIRLMLGAAGTHILQTSGFVPTTLPGMLQNFLVAAAFTPTLFHANIFTACAFSLNWLPLLVNALVLLALMVATLRWCGYSLFRVATPEAKIVNVLVWSLLALLAADITSTLGGVATRYLYPLLFLSGIVSFALLSPMIKQKVLNIAILCVLLMNATLFVVAVCQATQATPPEAQLITLLQKHHLKAGLGSYWVAPMVTVQSEGQIVVRQVTATGYRIHPYEFLVDQHWFDASQLSKANFIVYMDSDNNSQPYYIAAIQSFYRPKYQYHVGVYTVLVWEAPLIKHMRPGYSFWFGKSV